MTDERANYISNLFLENFERARRLGASHSHVALAAATCFTIDDIINKKGIDAESDRLANTVNRLKQIYEEEMQ